MNKMNKVCKLSIVLPTLGRTKEVDMMLSSIYSFHIKSNISIEIIIVDQNFSNILDPIVEKYKEFTFPIIHHKVSFRGLSKAKNYGAKISSGQFICFVDDDAEFTDNTINKALERLESGNYDIVSGRCIDRNGKNSVINFKEEESMLTINAFENRFVESTMFFNKSLCEQYHYDENMGLGAFYGAEEGYDLVYRMLKNGVRIFFDPDIKFYHPQTVISHQGSAAVRRAFTYRCGFGYLCKKHGLTRKYLKRVISVVLYLFYLLVFKPKDFRYYFGELLGLLVGRFI